MQPPAPLPLLPRDVLGRVGVDEGEFLETARAWFDLCGRLSSTTQPPPRAPAPAWLRSLPPMSVEETRSGLAARVRLGGCWFHCEDARVTAFVGAELPLTVQIAIAGRRLSSVFHVHPLLHTRDWTVERFDQLRSGGRRLHCSAHADVGCVVPT